MAVASTSALSAVNTGRTPTQSLGQKEFLNLLATQMSRQDPMNPMKDTDFIAQLAQFTSLEQAKSTSQNMAMLQATSLLGKDVSIKGDSANQVIQGQVTGVEIKDNQPQIFVGNSSSSYELGRLLSIEPASPDSQAPPTAAPATTNSTTHAPAPSSWIPPKLAAILNP